MATPLYLASFAIVGLIVGLPLLVVGLIFIKQGRWPPRLGSEPHCRNCEYLLIGITSARCPECGTELNERMTARGKPNRRAGLVWSGVAMILVALIALAPVTMLIERRVDWYRWYPAFML